MIECTLRKRTSGSFCKQNQTTAWQNKHISTVVGPYMIRTIRAIGLQ